MSYWQVMLAYAGPFVGLAILFLIAAYIQHRIRLKNEAFDRTMTKWLPRVFNRKVGTTIALLSVIALCLYAWTHGWGGYYE